MEEYSVIGRIGEGAHGIVMKGIYGIMECSCKLRSHSAAWDLFHKSCTTHFLGRHKKSGSIVALKKVLLKRLEDGIPETALREIKALQVGIEVA